MEKVMRKESKNESKRDRKRSNQWKVRTQEEQAVAAIIHSQNNLVISPPRVQRTKVYQM